MWIEFSKVAVFFCFCTNVAFAYYSRQDYGKQSEKGLSNKYSSSLVSASSFNNDNSKLRQSRYPKFDKVKSRIENMNSQAAPPTVKIRHKGWSNYRPTTTTTTTTTTDDGLFDTYGDLDDDYDATLEDDDDELEYDDDNDTDDEFFDTIEDVQAEEATERPLTTPKPSTSFSRRKWETLGNNASVAESRRLFMKNAKIPAIANEQRSIEAVLNHFVRVNRQGKCKDPSPKVIPVQKEHPDPTKVYTPHCTVLHRCAEDTGCCKHDTKCQWKSRELIQLYFYTRTVGSPQNKVEKLIFYNHTECECKEKSNYDAGEPTTSTLLLKSADLYYRPPQNLIRCICPKHFQSYALNNRCSCDCEEGNLDCIQLKKGKEHLSMTDRICISNSECSMPVCEYGAYVRKEGKCPSKKEKIEDYRRIRINY